MLRQPESNCGGALSEKTLPPGNQQAVDQLSGFEKILERHGIDALKRRSPGTLQINVGKLCNQACHHCHVEAGPGRREIMATGTAARVIEVLAASPGVEADLTGGAPELNPNFRWLVASARQLGRRVRVRCNLTVILVPGMDWLPEFYRVHQVDLTCSLPCYSADNVEAQRGEGVFAASIEALRRLNAIGYGRGRLKLDLVYNPVAAALPPPQEALEIRYREELFTRYGVVFDRLLTITNMPIGRFARQLRRTGNYELYLKLLAGAFNRATLEALMCRDLVSVGWDGRLYDCDFNQMAEKPIIDPKRSAPLTIWDIGALGELSGNPIALYDHCHGCTAGAGSSCGGALA